MDICAIGVHMCKEYISDLREFSLNMGGGGVQFFRKVGKGGHLFLHKKISKLNALSIKLIAILTDKLSFQPHI